MNDKEIEDLFDEFLDSPEIEQLASTLDGREYNEAKAIWLRLVTRAILDSGGQVEI